jgi:hypothetical protein
MTKQQFDAAHDKLLEPAPDVTDGWPEADEMDLADIRKQEQRDLEDWLAEQYRQRQEDGQ